MVKNQGTEMQGWNAQSLKMLPRVGTIFDVGVAHGTPELYAAFPESFLVLIEPLKSFKGAINSILKKRRAAWIEMAVSSKPGSRTLILRENLDVASFHERVVKSSKRTGEIDVEVTTLDHIVEKQTYATKPFGLKIDTEGHEDEVIRGATKFLKHASFVIAEISICPRFDKGYKFSDFIILMQSRGFVLHDVLRVTRNEGRAMIMDAVFLPE